MRIRTVHVARSTRRHALHCALIIVAAIAALPRDASSQERRMGMGSSAPPVLTVEGKPVFPRSLQGGTIEGTVVVERSAGGGSATKKHIANIAFGEIVAEVPLTGAQPLLDWAESSFEGKPAEKSGSVVTGDAAGTRDFTNAVITALTVPALDASSRSAGYFTVHIAPATIIARKEATPQRPMGQKAAMWMTSNFRFELDGIQTARVAQIDSFTITMAQTNDRIGVTREPTKTPGEIVFPNLNLTVTESGAADWWKWNDDFLIRGAHNDSDEKNGAIVFLAPDMKTELGRVALDHCGLVHVEPSAAIVNSERPGTVSVELYCERMSLVPAQGTK